MSDLSVLSSPTPDTKLEISFRPIWKSVGKWLGLAMLGLIYFPLLWLVLLSISRDPLSGIPGQFSLEHYRACSPATRGTCPWSQAW